MKPLTHSPSELQMRAIRPTATHKSQSREEWPILFLELHSGSFVPLRYIWPHLCFWSFALYHAKKKWNTINSNGCDFQLDTILLSLSPKRKRKKKSYVLTKFFEKLFIFKCLVAIMCKYIIPNCLSRKTIPSFRISTKTQIIKNHNN